MSNEIDDGGPAFPCMPPDDGEGRGSAAGYPYPDSGMSLRDWFAGQALPAAVTMIANGTHSRPDGISGPDFASETAYKLADAMLAARKAKP